MTLTLSEQLKRRKPIVFQQMHHEGEELARNMTTFHLMMFGVGATIGTGIFFVLGEAVPKAGPAVLVSFVIAGIAAGLNGQTVIIIRQAGETGQLYGSVSSRDVAEALTDAGFQVARSQVDLADPIKNVGLHVVPLTSTPKSPCRSTSTSPARTTKPPARPPAKTSPSRRPTTRLPPNSPPARPKRVLPPRTRTTPTNKVRIGLESERPGAIPALSF